MLNENMEKWRLTYEYTQTGHIAIIFNRDYYQTEEEIREELMRAAKYPAYGSPLVDVRVVKLEKVNDK